MVDYRSPIARNWISYFLREEHEVHVISTFPVSPEPVGLKSFHVVPVGFSSLSTGLLRRYISVSVVASPSTGVRRSGRLSAFAPAVNAFGLWLMMWVFPLDAWRRRHAVRAILAGIAPDLVHAMRIPSEGMLASEALWHSKIPLLVSVWGNDFTLWAKENPFVRAGTRRAMKRTDGLHTDCRRDGRLAQEHGLASHTPRIVMPGNGGVQRTLFAEGAVSPEVYAQWGLSPDHPVVFNPRNFRPKYVRNDVFFRAAEEVLASHPDVQVVCVGMAGNPIAEGWRSGLANPKGVHLLPSVTRNQMAELFRIADISVSPSTHDGTPNTLLEAMACGAFPVVGNIESIREWIEDGVNGALCDPADQASVAAAILKGLDGDTRARAAAINRRLIEQRADFETGMPQAERFYEQLVAARQSASRISDSGSRRRTPSQGTLDGV